MKVPLKVAVTAGAVLGVAAVVWAMGGDISPDEVARPLIAVTPAGAAIGWPEGVQELVNARPRVHGFHVNARIWLFYAGETGEFNQFMKEYAAIPDITHEVTLHVGPKKARSPWDKADRDIDVNWGIVIVEPSISPDQKLLMPRSTSIDLWLGGAIDLANLEIPKNVVVKSGGEIEKFVSEHAKNAM
jgi:hypothetical protein